MTDPVTEVDEIVVNGQRRRPNGTFPRRPTIPGGGSDSPGDEPITVDIDGGPSGSVDLTDPCADPETAREWNLDAAAAEALRRMRQAAADRGEPDFAAREYGTALYLMPDGSIRIGTIRAGATQGGSVAIQYDEYPESYLIAVIHSHPSSGGFAHDVAVLNYIFGQSIHQDLTRLYGVRPVHQPGELVARYALSYYDASNIQSTDEPPEVNPEGEPCPGASIS